jgi:hypothetical protein
MGIYVEIRIRGGMDEQWRRRQDPGLHEQWDLRFSEIVSLPRPDETMPHRFSWYDDGAGRFRIEVAVHNRRCGPLFGYRGSFDVEWRETPAGSMPKAILPVREERRE